MLWTKNLNSILMDCITWDMDEIIYTCSAEYIGFTFPKRKWWDIIKRPRKAQLQFGEFFSGEEIGVSMQIFENVAREDVTDQGARDVVLASGKDEFFSDSGLSGCLIWVPPVYRSEIWQEFIKQSRKMKRYETLLVVDSSGRRFPELLFDNVEDINYLAVLTKRPEAYERVLDALAREYGLFGMVFTEYRDFVQYQKQICAGSTVIVFKGDRDWTENEDGRRFFLRFPKGSCVLEFEGTSTGQRKFIGKRMENDYATLPIFLDNIIKNRYNSVVNEGLQIRYEQESYLQQNVSRTDDKNKLGEKRKGIRKWKKRRIS